MRPVILELGSKNQAIVSNNANLATAALGVMRSACSRVYVQREVQAEFLERLLSLTANLVIGDPTRRDVYLGPVINRSAWHQYQEYCGELGRAGHILCGGQVLEQGDLARGCFCAPTVVADMPQEHSL